MDPINRWREQYFFAVASLHLATANIVWSVKMLEYKPFGEI